jgi:hypothetical protein
VSNNQTRMALSGTFLLPEASDTMRSLKRSLLRIAELGVLFFGLCFSLGLTAVIAGLTDNFGGSASFGIFTLAVLFGGIVLTFAILIIFRRKTWQWKLKSDAAAFMANRARRQLHPRQAKYIRVAQQILLWLPTACAALTVFFLPIASQILIAGNRVVPHYRIPVPTNWIVFRRFVPSDSFATILFSDKGASRYGFTPLWFDRSLPSGVTIGVTDPANPHIWSRPEMEKAFGRTTHVAQTRVTSGRHVFDCFEYRDTYDVRSLPPSPLYPRVLWEVLCSMQPNGRDYNLYASFAGHEDEIPAFYRVLRGATPAY